MVKLALLSLLLLAGAAQAQSVTCRIQRHVITEATGYTYADGAYTASPQPPLAEFSLFAVELNAPVTVQFPYTATPSALTNRLTAATLTELARQGYTVSGVKFEVRR